MKILPVAAACLLALAAAGCSSSDKTSSPPSPTPVTTSAAPTAPPTSSPTAAPTTAPTTAAGGAVHVVQARRGNTFSPSDLTIAAGDSIKVEDVDADAPHNFVVNGVGTSDTMNEGDVFTLRFPTAGTFEFVCTFHEALGMKGTVRVT